MVDTLLENNTQSPHYVFTVCAYCFENYTHRVHDNNDASLAARGSLQEPFNLCCYDINVTSISSFRHFYIPLTAEYLQSLIVDTLQSLSHEVDVSTSSLPTIQELLIAALGRGAPPISLAAAFQFKFLSQPGYRGRPTSWISFVPIEPQPQPHRYIDADCGRSCHVARGGASNPTSQITNREFGNATFVVYSCRYRSIWIQLDHS